MTVNIQFKRGLKSRLPATAPVGTPLWCTDTKELYIGTGSGVQKIESNGSSSDEIISAVDTTKKINVLPNYGTIKLVDNSINRICIKNTTTFVLPTITESPDMNYYAWTQTENSEYPSLWFTSDEEGYGTLYTRWSDGRLHENCENYQTSDFIIMDSDGTTISLESYDYDWCTTTNLTLTRDATKDVLIDESNPAIFHQILVQLEMPYAQTINLGTAKYFNGEAPDIYKKGEYNLIYEYDGYEWSVGVIKKGTV